MCVGKDELCQGSVLADSDSDSHSDDDDDEPRAGEELLERARQRCSQTKVHGTVRVLWNNGNVSRHRVGREGHVDVWCIDTVAGGQYYRDHLAVLDSELTGGRGLARDDDDDDDDQSRKAIL